VLISKYYQNIITTGIAADAVIETILEMAAGVGVMSNRILDRGVNSLRLYEHQPKLNSYLQKMFSTPKSKRFKKVEVFPHNLHNLGRILYQDDQVAGTKQMDEIMFDIDIKVPPGTVKISSTFHTHADFV
jgi:hypothetical protein